MVVTGHFARVVKGARNLLAPEGVARWNWFLLLVVGLCTVISILLAGIAPLFSSVMATAGLRSVLAATPTSSELAVRANLVNTADFSVLQSTELVTSSIDKYLSPYLKSTMPQRMSELAALPVVPVAAGNNVLLNALDLAEVGPHLTLLQGRLPQVSGDALEIVLTPESARLLGVKVGSTLTLPVDVTLTYPGIATPPGETTRLLALHVVGLVQADVNDVFWHGLDFSPYYNPRGTKLFAPGLTSDQALQQALARVLTPASTSRAGSSTETDILKVSLSVQWFYRLDSARLASSQLDTMLAQLQNTQADLQARAWDSGQKYVYRQLVFSDLVLTGDPVDSDGNVGLLAEYHARLSILNIPITALAFLLAVLLFFFVWALVELLMDRQVGAFALYRSRGASRGQIFGFALPQLAGISLLSLPLAWLCLPGATELLARLFLPERLRDALNVITSDPLGAIWNKSCVPTLVLALALVAMQLFALWRASRLNALALMRSASRSQARPFWQRFYLDLAAGVLALAGFGLALYLANTSGLLDEQSQVLLIAPLSLLAPLFLLLAVGLFLLRGFAWLLYLGSRLAARGRGLVTVLALTFTARAPRQALRVVMLLMLAITFMISSLAFSATLQQRARDVADYTAGADFSGMFPINAPARSLQETTALYARIPGVSSASAGYVERVSASDGQTLALSAIDTTTFARSALWQRPASGLTLDRLLAQLRLRRGSVAPSGAVPAIVDASTWDALGLHAGSILQLRFQGAGMKDTLFRVVARVQQLPGWHADLPGGVLVDYQSLAAALPLLTPNYIWLRAYETPMAEQSIRAALARPALRLDELADRQALYETLAADPLARNLSGLLATGAFAALFLALMSSLLFSWLHVRGRQAQLVVLRALGMTTGRVAALLFWEQSLVYLVALVLGGLLGLLLAFTGVPDLVFSAIPVGKVFLNPAGVESGVFSTLQAELPVRLVLPPTLFLVLPGLALICGLALLLMVRQAQRRPASSALRLEDAGQVEFATPGELRRWKREAQRRAKRRLREQRTSLPAFLVLLRWRFRRSWGLLVLEGAGLVLATMLLCLVPLLTSATSSIGLSDLLSGPAVSTTLTLSATTGGLSNRVMQNLHSQFDGLLRGQSGVYLDASVPSTIKVSGFNLVNPAPPASHYYTYLVGEDMVQVKSGLTLVQGRLPGAQPVQGEVETILSSSVASQLHVGVGSSLQFQFQSFSYRLARHTGINLVETLRLRVVGLFSAVSRTNPELQVADFAYNRQGDVPAYTLMVSNGALLQAFDQLATAQQVETVLYTQTFQLRWFYHVNPAQLAASQLEDVSNQLNQGRTQLAALSSKLAGTSNAGRGLHFPYLLSTELTNPVPGSYQLPVLLDQYYQHLAVLDLPLGVLSLQIGTLLLFFLVLVVGLLLEHQSETMALLRSRGASNNQLAGPLFAQLFLLGGGALLLGPVLAFLLCVLIVQTQFHVEATAIVSRFLAQPGSVLSVAWYALGTVLVCVGVLSLQMHALLRQDALASRQDKARSTRRPFWQRLNLDLLAALLALFSYALSLYLAGGSDALDEQTRLLIVAPLTLLAPLFLLLSVVLLALRGFPLALRLGAWRASRGRGMVSQVALAQMARSPRRAQSASLLLALTTAFAIFTLIFSASQAQHAGDVSAYLAGADFRGTIAPAANLDERQVERLYTSLPGILAASAGFSTSGITADSGSFVVNIEAVDSATFAQVATWNAEDSSASLAHLLPLLRVPDSARSSASSPGTVLPVIVDTVLARNEQLHIGSLLVLNVDNLSYQSLTGRVAAIVTHLPTVNNDATASNSEVASTTGGMLLDYHAYAEYCAAALEQAAAMQGSHYQPSSSCLPVNRIWLRTQDDAQALAKLRQILQDSPALAVTDLFDRRAIDQQLSDDPLQTGLLVLLELGACAALFLALLGSLSFSWLSVSVRLANFHLLRALGSTRAQVLLVLLWEQLIIYGTALLLGSGLGAFLIKTIVPTLTFVNLPANGVLAQLDTQGFYNLQRALPVQIVVPQTLVLVFAVLLFTGLLVLFAMSRVVYRLAISQALRLSED